MQDFEIKTTLKELIARFHSSGISNFYKRDIETPNLARVNKVFVIVGPRRAGKTYFLYQEMERLIKTGKKIQDFIYLNFENEKLSEIKSSQLGLIIDAYQELYDEKKPVVFLDEIQNVTGWEKFVRRINEEGYQVYVTGSNSKLLSREIATSLRGRDYQIQVLPLSFKEFINFRGIELNKNWEFDESKNKVKRLFGEYFRLSGFPEIVLENKIDFIDEYFKTMLYRDIIERYKVKNTDLLRLQMKYITRQYAQEYSINKFNNFAKSNGYSSSTSVVQKYSRMLEEINFCFFISVKQKSFKKESSYLKKTYVADQGFINYYNSEKDNGRILENIIFLELMRREKNEINYYKNGFECDFITKDACIQVCYQITEENKKREITGLKEAQQKFKKKKELIITYDQEIETEGKITTPAWKWLLEEK